MKQRGRTKLLYKIARESRPTGRPTGPRTQVAAATPLQFKRAQQLKPANLTPVQLKPAQLKPAQFKPVQLKPVQLQASRF